MSSSESEPEPEPKLQTGPESMLSTINTNLTTLLTHHIPNTHHFKPKWSHLRSKLTHLQTQIYHFTPHPHLDTQIYHSTPQPDPLSLSLLSSLTQTLTSVTSLAVKSLNPDGKLKTQIYHFTPHSHPLFLSLLSSITQTLTSVTSLAVKSQNPNGIPNGKLKTQNDLDSVTATLDRHLHDLELLSATDFDDSKQCLLARVRVGSVEERVSGLDEVLGFLDEDDKNLVALVAAGVVPVVVRLLDSSVVELREKAVSVISRVSGFDSSKDVLFGEGLSLVNNLVRVVESGSVLAKEKACIVLQVLSLSKDNARAIVSRGGISSLLEICRYGTPNAQAMASSVLRNLARFDEIRVSFIDENGVGVLVRLSGSGTCLARENCIGCLANLVVGDDDRLKWVVVNEGGVDSLRNYWDVVGVDGSLEVGVELLRNLGSCHSIGEVLIDVGFVGRLVPSLNCGVLSLRIMAAFAVYELGFSSKAKREMGELGCISSLVKLIDGKATKEREAGAKALSRVLLCNYNRKIFKKEERGIVGIVQLLDPLINNLDKKWPIRVLTTLVHSKKCRKQMVGVGACVYLHKLVEFDVEGAKKLLDSLGRSKLWGVFARP